jgi:hypothetical protein
LLHAIRDIESFCLIEHAADTRTVRLTSVGTDIARAVKNGTIRADAARILADVSAAAAKNENAWNATEDGSGQR